MKIGLAYFPTDYSMNVIELGRAAEDLGFESLFVTEHTHIPTSRKSPWPGGPDLPLEYSHTLDPFVALAAVGAATTRLKLGTGVCLVVEHDPITLAKVVASVDLLSGGRVLFGVGAGWNLEEMADHGTDPASRFRLMRERVLAMKQIWTNDEAEFHGRHVSFDPLWSWPKPVQRPHPPILVGGDGANTLKRVVEYGDEWMPIPGRGSAPFGDRIAELQEMARAAGRDSIPVTLFGPRPDPAVLEHYQQIGVGRVLLRVLSDPADTVLPLLKQWSGLVAQFA